MPKQLAFLLHAVKLSEQLQGTRKRLCGTTQPWQPNHLFRSQRGVNPPTPIRSGYSAVPHY